MPTTASNDNKTYEEEANVDEIAVTGDNDHHNDAATAAAATATTTASAGGLMKNDGAGRNNDKNNENWFDTAAGVAGNVLEWYDFALFGYLSDIIAQVFFPPEPDAGENNDNLIKTFAIFGGAFLMRPIGGLLIGFVGDKHGRKTALTRSLFLMAVPTTAMGCLPTYGTVGILAPILLAICRLLQGVSVGGQLPASLVYTVEQRPRNTWGYYGSLPMVAANIGTVLGNLCAAALRQILSEEQLISWGWRLPFFSGILIALVACYLKRHGADVHTTRGVYDESSSNNNHSEQQQQQQQQQKTANDNPIRAAFRKGNRLALLQATLVPTIWAAGFYVSFVWMAVYMDELLNPPVPNAFWINTCSMLWGMTLIMPLAGGLTDRPWCGRLFTMTMAAIGLTALGPLLLIVISRGNGWLAFLSQLALGILLSFFGGPLCAWLVEGFAPEIRLTSASIGYDLAHAVVGGFSPLMATAMFDRGGKWAPAFMYVIFGTTSLLGISIAYFCGGNQKEEVRSIGNDGDENQLELQQRQVNSDDAVEDELPEIS